MMTESCYKTNSTTVKCSVPNSSIGVNCPTKVTNEPVCLESVRGAKYIDSNSVPYHVRIEFAGTSRVWYYQPYDETKAKKDFDNIKAVLKKISERPASPPPTDKVEELISKYEDKIRSLDTLLERGTPRTAVGTERLRVRMAERKEFLEDLKSLQQGETS